MAQRDDVTIDWFLSPRIIRVQTPSTEISVQDLHDTVTEHESRQHNLIYDRIIETAGKQDLGGGVSVGLSATLLNAKVAFDARKTSVISDGYVTTADTNGRILIDENADFITSGVLSGAMIVNFDDFSIASVVDVLSSTRILTDFLADGYSNQFNLNDTYKIWNEIQVNLDGGNVVAVDGYNNAISPVLPTFGTQVVRTSSSSATLLNQRNLEAAAFFGGVSLNLSSSFSGTEFPNGTPQQPVNNFSDALAISSERGIKTLFVIGQTLVPTGIDLSSINITGINAAATTLIVSPGVTTNFTNFSRMTITGTLDGYALIEQGGVQDITCKHLTMRQCLLLGTISYNNALGAPPVHIVDCWSGIPGINKPIIDLGGTGTSVSIRGYHGGLEIINKTGNEPLSIDMSSGVIVLSSSVVANDIVITGTGELINNSSVVPDITGLVSPINVANATLKKTLPFLPDS